MEELRIDLNKACESLGVEEDVRELATKMLDRCFSPASETIHTAQDDEVKRLKFACLLYLSKKVRSKDPVAESASWGLPEVLKHFKLSIPDFLQELPVLVKEATPTLSMMFGEEIERKLSVREIQTAFVHVLVLGKKARDMYGRYLNLPTEVDGQLAPTLRLLWTLFILAKAELLGPLPDLVSSFNLLVCVVNVILAHLPQSADSPDFADKSNFPMRVESGLPDTLASIAMISKTDISEVKALADNLQKAMMNLLEGITDPDPAFPFPDGQIVENRLGFPGLLHQDKTDQVMQRLDAKYKQMYWKVGEFDEREFVHRKEAEAAANKLATPPSMTKCQVRTPLRSNGNSSQGLPTGTPMRFMPSPLRPAGYMMKTPSPVRMGTSSFFGASPGVAPRTPLTESMHLTAWIREILAKCTAEPTEALKEYFTACDEDVTDAVVRRVEVLSGNIFPAIPGPSGIVCMQSSLAKERKLEGIKLYYRVLENMLRAEESRTGKKNFTFLLKNETFHKCLLACTFEMVVASYRMVTLTFPAVLERMQLKAFDLCKVIETFVRHEPQLPRELKRHLFNMEEKMLECLAWERGSSLYPRLISACNDSPVVPKTSLQEVFESKEAQNTARGPSSAPEGPTSPAEPVGDVPTPAEASRPSQTTPSKRSRESSPQEEDTSPPKLQKGVHSPVIPAHMDSPQETRNTGLTGGLLSPMRGPGQSAFQAFMSPMRPTATVNHPFMGTLPTSFGSASKHLERPGRAVTADFLRKVLKLGLLRLEDLCDRIDFKPMEKKDMLTQVYTMVQHVIYQQTHLLYNRHLDQILLSALYGICKVNHLRRISFKEIIQHYKKQPQAKTDIFRTVIIAQSEPDLAVSQTGDIIEFYNSIFIPTVKPFVLQLGQRKATLVQPATVNTARRALLSPSGLQHPQNGLQMPPPPPEPKGTPSAVKVYLSPLRQSPKQPFLTPRSKIFYAGRMGESSSIYQSPSKDFKLINNRIAAHSQQPVAVYSPNQAASLQRQSEAGQSSSDHSCSTGPSSGEDVSAVEPQSFSQVNGHARSRPASSQAEQSSGAGSPLPMMTHAIGRRSGTSGLDDLHNAAILLGGSDRDDSPPTSPTKQQRARRSRRQAGRAPQRVDL